MNEVPVADPAADRTPADQESAGHAAPAPRQAASVLVSIIVPTFNEKDNVAELVRRIDAQFRQTPWEVIFVDDDSPDGTAEFARSLAQTDPRVRCIHRIGRRGLSSACIEGMMASSAPYVAVMDGDLQHDEAILPRMLKALTEDGFELAVGSRYVEGGSIGEWDNSRAFISRLATRLSHALIPRTLKDPMSGFFMVRRTVVLSRVRHLSALGFKILLDLFASGKEPLRFIEIPFQFRTRQAGESKLDNQAAWDYVMLLLDKLVGRWVPVRFLAFALIGGLGLLVHLAVLTALFKGLDAAFGAAQVAATTTAMVFNFAVNNVMTYRDRRLTGIGWVKGLLSFMLACSVGAFANVGIANYFFDRNGPWLLAALAGIVVGAVWNYAATSFYTWGNKARK